MADRLDRIRTSGSNTMKMASKRSTRSSSMTMTMTMRMTVVAWMMLASVCEAVPMRSDPNVRLFFGNNENNHNHKVLAKNINHKINSDVRNKINSDYVIDDVNNMNVSIDYTRLASTHGLVQGETPVGHMLSLLEVFFIQTGLLVSPAYFVLDHLLLRSGQPSPNDPQDDLYERNIRHILSARQINQSSNDLKNNDHNMNNVNNVLRTTRFAQDHAATVEELFGLLRSVGGIVEPNNKQLLANWSHLGHLLDALALTRWGLLIAPDADSLSHEQMRIHLANGGLRALVRMAQNSSPNNLTDRTAMHHRSLVKCRASRFHLRRIDMRPFRSAAARNARHDTVSRTNADHADHIGAFHETVRFALLDSPLIALLRQKSLRMTHAVTILGYNASDNTYLLKDSRMHEPFYAVQASSLFQKLIAFYYLLPTNSPSHQPNHPLTQPPHSSNWTSDTDDCYDYLSSASSSDDTMSRNGHHRHTPVLEFHKYVTTSSSASSTSSSSASSYGTESEDGE